MRSRTRKSISHESKTRGRFKPEPKVPFWILHPCSIKWGRGSTASATLLAARRGLGGFGVCGCGKLGGVARAKKSPTAWLGFLGFREKPGSPGCLGSRRAPANLTATNRARHAGLGRLSIRERDHHCPGGALPVYPKLEDPRSASLEESPPVPVPPAAERPRQYRRLACCLVP